MSRRDRLLTFRLRAAAVILSIAVGGCAAKTVNISAAGSAAPGSGYLGARITRAIAPQPRCTIYVAPSGRMSSDGASKRAPTTLAKASSIVPWGGVVCLEPGRYDMSSQLVLSHSGTASQPVVYRSDGGTALLQYTGPVAVGGLLQTASFKHWRGAHDLVFEGLTIDGADRIDGGIFVSQGSHHVTIENCVIRNTGSSGISLNATDYVTVRGNQIYHAGYAHGWSSGISLWYGGSTHIYGGRTAWYGHAPGFHNYIVDNIVSGTYDNSSYHSDGNGIIVDGSRSIPPVLIANNLVYENGGAGIAVYSTYGQVWIVNNTAYANGLQLNVDAGEASDYQVIKAANVHLVNDVAYGRQNRASYSYAYVYRNVASSVTWLGDIAYNGTTAGISSSILGNRRDYQNVDPAFVDPPPVPKGRAPWANAVPPWEIGHALDLRPHSAVVQTGVNLIPSHLFADALVPGLRRYLAADIAARGN